METGNEGGFLHIYQDDFSADINIYSTDSNQSVSQVDKENGATRIDIRIDYKEGVAITSTFNQPSAQPTPPPDQKNLQISDQNDYVLPFSNSRSVTREDLAGLTDWQLKVARNEIYARHGRTFVHKDLSCYFDKLSWYEIDPEYSENKLSSLEVSNAVFILNYEKEINSTLIDKDTGCK